VVSFLREQDKLQVSKNKVPRKYLDIVRIKYVSNLENLMMNKYVIHTSQLVLLGKKLCGLDTEEMRNEKI
jgi:hypothetical protein